MPANVNSLADQHLGVDGHLKAKQAGQSSGLLAHNICTYTAATHTEHDDQPGHVSQAMAAKLLLRRPSSSNELCCFNLFRGLLH